MKAPTFAAVMLAALVPWAAARPGSPASSPSRPGARHDNGRGSGREKWETRERREALILLANRAGQAAAIDTLRGMSPKDKDFLRRRRRILHPLD